MTTEQKKVYLAVLDITSFSGISADAEHVYGYLILSTRPEVTIANIEEHIVSSLGKVIKLEYEMSIEDAIALDKKDSSGGIYRRQWELGERTTGRFNTFEQAVAAGIAKWKELGLDCPFISLYEGEKYSIEGEGETVVLNSIIEGSNG